MKISIILEALTGSFETDMTRASKTAQKRMKEIEKTAKEVGVVIGAAFVAAATASAYALKKAIDNADQLSKAAQKIGIPTEVLSELKYAGQQSGIVLEQLQAGLSKLVKFQADAAQGSKENIRVFDAFGIAIKDSFGHLRNSSDVLRDFADVFHALPDGAEKSALAIKVFGKSGEDLIPLLNQGRQGLQDMADEAHRLGAVIDAETGKKAEAFNDNIARLETAIGGLATAVAADLLPDLIKLTDEFVDNTTKGDQLQSTAHEIADGIRFIGEAASATDGLIRSITSDFIALYQVMAGLSRLTPPGWLAAKLSGDTASASEHFRLAGVAHDQANASDPFMAHPARGAPAPTFDNHATFRGLGVIKREAAAQDAAKGLFTPVEESAKKAHAEVDKLQQAFDQMHASMAQQIALYGDESEAAKVRYETEFGELAKLDPAKKAELIQQAEQIDNLNALAEAQKNYAEAEEKANKVMSDAATDLSLLLSDMQFEEDQLGLTNAQRVVSNELRRLENGMTEDQIKLFEEQHAAQIQAIGDTEKAIEQQQKATDALDSFRSSFESNVEDLAHGTESISDFFKRMVDDIIAQIIRLGAQQITSGLFGEQGQSGGGLFGSLFGALFGGSSTAPATSTGPGHAYGGPVYPNTAYPVGEKGPELFIPHASGTIIPNHALRDHGSGITQIFNENYSAPDDPRTRDQRAARVGYETRRAMARAGR